MKSSTTSRLFIRTKRLDRGDDFYMTRLKIPILKILFWAAVACWVVFSSSFVVMHSASNALVNGDKSLAIVAGFLFWIPLVIATTLLTLINLARRKVEGRKKKRKRQWGVYSFFTCKPGYIADFMCICWFTSFVICLFTPSREQIITMIFFALFVLAFCMHCLFNGETFRYVQSHQKGANNHG